VRRVAIWINRREAIVVIGPGTPPGDRARELERAAPHLDRDGWLGYRFEPHRHQLLKDFYDEVGRLLSLGDSILIVGPGHEKHRFARYLADRGNIAGKVTAVLTVPHLTSDELISRAEALFESDSEHQLG
jgi:hypothetical protein